MNNTEEPNLLDRPVIVDATLGRGGSRGSYAVQPLDPEPLGGTFGNLMVSDAQVVNIDLGRVMDMPVGGYSSTGRLPTRSAFRP